MDIPHITARQLASELKAKHNILLVDVREPWEHEAFNIGGLLIPMQDVMAKITQIPTDKKVVLYCQKGIRSSIIIQRLQHRFGYNNLVNLQGGLAAWKEMEASG